MKQTHIEFSSGHLPLKLGVNSRIPIVQLISNEWFLLNHNMRGIWLNATFAITKEAT